jgi:hypothetical protein
MVYVKEDMIAKIMKLVPHNNEFGRMLDLSPKDFKLIVGEKPAFPYSREEEDEMMKDEEKMKKEYKATVMVWEDELLTWALYAYKKFVEWNRKCLDLMDDDELEHLGWMCDCIAQRKVRNMDMESCGQFRTEGLYFNEDSVLVIYNGR